MVSPACAAAASGLRPPPSPKRPVGGLALFGMGAAGAAAAAAAVHKGHLQLSAALTATRATLVIPGLESVADSTPDISAATSALDTCAQTLAKIQAFKLENNGLLSRQLREKLEKLERIVTKLTERMGPTAGDAAYREKAAEALGLVKYETALAEAMEALEKEADAVETLEKVQSAMQHLIAAQRVVDRLPVPLNAPGKSPLASRLCDEGGKLMKKVRFALDEDDSLTGSALFESVEACAGTIVEGPRPAYSPEELSTEEQAIIASLEQTLCTEGDGVSVKNTLATLITMGLHLNRTWARKDLGALDTLSTDPDLLNMAELVIGLLVLHHASNSSLMEAASNPAVYRERSEKIGKGVMHTHALAWQEFVVRPLTASDGTSALGGLFMLLDGAGARLSEEVERVYKEAWDLYFDILEAQPNPKGQKRSDVRTLLTNQPMYP